MIILESDTFYLRNISLDDCNENYLSWMNDSEINKFLESRFTVHTIDSLKDFVISMNNSNNNILFAIVDKESDKHIGNIKLGDIHPVHKYADIGLVPPELFSKFTTIPYNTPEEAVMKAFGVE